MNRFLFIGERRSPMAIEKDWSWQSCQETEPRLCARQLFAALEAAGIDPRQQEFQNLWYDGGDLNTATLMYIRVSQEDGVQVVGMGNKAQTELTEQGIEHIGIVHPAARGKWRRQEVYNKHIRQKLT